jgi:hypothetical protein
MDERGHKKVFHVTLSCADGFHGEAQATSCKEAGGPYIVEGCTADKCRRPSAEDLKTTGVTEKEGNNLLMDGFSVTLKCLEDYTPAAGANNFEASKCASNDQLYTYTLRCEPNSKASPAKSKDSPVVALCSILDPTSKDKCKDQDGTECSQTEYQASEKNPKICPRQGLGAINRVVLVVAIIEGVALLGITGYFLWRKYAVSKVLSVRLRHRRNSHPSSRTYLVA